MTRLWVKREDETPIDKWQRTLLVALPFGAAAFLIGWLLERPSAQASVLDLVGMPLMAVFLIGLELLLALRAHTLRRVVYTVVAGASGFFLAKLVFLLFFTEDAVLAQLEMTETFYWIPVTYLLSYLIPGVRGGRSVTFLFTGLVAGFSLLYVFKHSFAFGIEAMPWGMLYALAQLNLANAVMLALTLTFISLKEDHDRQQVHSEAMERIAVTDALTGLPNRLMLERELERAVAVARSEGSRVALLFIDLDRFKVVNDTLGHEAGDALLEGVAARLRQEMREGDFVARISGDEFIVLLRNPGDAQHLPILAGRLLAVLAAPFQLGAQAYSISASIGSSVFPDDADSAEALLRHADSAMYRVKKNGKNGIEHYEADAGQALAKRRALEKDLRAALDGRQLHLTFQPIVDLGTNRILSFEALLRWTHPDYGAISPDEFIPVAEESGLITALGNWVLEEACSQAKRWQRLGLGAFRVAVNVSPLQFLNPGFFGSVLGALSKSALAPEYLELELTESVVMQPLEDVGLTLRRLRRLGISIALDDFGSGYSSLAYLRDLPLDVVKIDRAFMRDLSRPREAPQFALALIQAILGLGAHLDLRVVVEGIESEEQLAILRTLGCHAAQGFYFSKPLTAEALETYLGAMPQAERVGPSSFTN